MMKKFSFIAACVMLGFTAGMTHAVTVTVQESAGPSREGRLVEIRENAVAVRMPLVDGGYDEHATVIPLETVNTISFPAVKRVEPTAEEKPETPGGEAPPVKAMAAPQPIFIATRDGSLFTAKTLTLAGGVYQTETAWGGAFPVNDSAVRYVLLRNDLLEDVPGKRTDADMRKVWEDALAMDSPEDVLVVEREGKLSYYRGQVLGMTAEAVRFEMGGDAVNVRRDRVFGFLPAKKPGFALPAVTGTPGVLTDVDGNRWTAVKLHLTEDEKLAWETPLGLAFSLPAEQLAELDFSDGRMVYLSSLKAEAVQWTPYVSLPGLSVSREAYFMPRMNASVNGNPLSLDGKTYARGIAMTSRTEMTFRLPDKYSRFQAVIGIDDEVRPNGNVTVTIRGDGTEIFHEDMDGTTAPQAVDLDISAYRRLTLFVDYGKDMDMSDHVDFADAKVVK